MNVGKRRCSFLFSGAGLSSRPVAFHFRAGRTALAGSDRATGRAAVTISKPAHHTTFFVCESTRRFVTRRRGNWRSPLAYLELAGITLARSARWRAVQ